MKKTAALLTPVYLLLLSGAALAEGDAKHEGALGDLEALSCSLCDDTELQEDLKSLRKKYGKEIETAAAKDGLKLSEEEMYQVLLKVRNVGYTKTCRFDFVKQNVALKAKDDGKAGVTKDQFERQLADPKRGPFLRLERGSKTIEKTVASVDSMEFPEMRNSFVDCDVENFNEAGKRDYETLRKEFEDFVRSGGKITQVEIACSASTLRNTCGEDRNVETISHLDLALRRCQTLQKRLTQDVNRVISEMNAKGAKLSPLAEESFTLDPGGENQDGTSGPLPPDNYRCTPTIHGNGEEPHENIADYDRYKYARVTVQGVAPPKVEKSAVETVSYYVPSFRNCEKVKVQKPRKEKVYTGQCAAPERIKRKKQPKAHNVSGKTRKTGVSGAATNGTAKQSPKSSPAQTSGQGQ